VKAGRASKRREPTARCRRDNEQAGIDRSRASLIPRAYASHSRVEGLLHAVAVVDVDVNVQHLRIDRGREGEGGGEGNAVCVIAE